MERMAIELMQELEEEMPDEVLALKPEKKSKKRARKARAARKLVLDEIEPSAEEKKENVEKPIAMEEQGGVKEPIALEKPTV